MITASSIIIGTPSGGSGGGGGGTPGGSDGQLQFNHIGTFAGLPGSVAASNGSLLLTPQADVVGLTINTVNLTTSNALNIDDQVGDTVSFFCNSSSGAGFDLGGSDGSSLTSFIQPGTIVAGGADTAGNSFSFGVISGVPAASIADAAGGQAQLNTDGTGNPTLLLTNGNTSVIVAMQAGIQTTVGAAGSASPLPALPTGYIQFLINDTPMVVPYYAAS